MGHKLIIVLAAARLTMFFSLGVEAQTNESTVNSTRGTAQEATQSASTSSNSPVISVATITKQARRGAVFESRLTVTRQGEDFATNLLVNGEEYFGDSGGGACRSDNGAFLGWTEEDGKPVARILCTIPRNIPRNAKIALIGFQFRNCEGPRSADGARRCHVVQAAGNIELLEDEGSGSQNSSRIETDPSDQILARILNELFGRRGSGSSTSESSRRGSGHEGSASSGGASGENNGEGGSAGGGNTPPTDSRVAAVANCLADRIGGAAGQRYRTHAPYIIDVLKKQSVSLEQAAYVFGTVRHETGDVRLLVEEPDSRGEAYFDRYQGRVDLCNMHPGDGRKFKGRGYVQLTGRGNYTKYTPTDMRPQDPGFNAVASRHPQCAGRHDFSSSLSRRVNLLTQPTAIVDDYSNAASILVNGMRIGAFTGARLSTYIGDGKKDYVNARRIINGMDKAEKFAEAARFFETALRACNY